MLRRLFSFILWAMCFLHVASQNKSQTPTFAFVGDIMMGTTYPSVQLPSNDGRQLFVSSMPFLKKVDLAIGNLEGTLCDEGETKKQPSKVSYAFRTPSHYADRLKDAGFAYMCLANNHIYDFGKYGVESPCRNLSSRGIAFSGLSELPESVVLYRNGRKIGICSFGYNHYALKHLNLKLVRKVITRLANSCDLVVVTFHGGGEGKAFSRIPIGTETFCGENRGDLRSFAHFCIDAGADIIVGHGPHVPRAMELYKHHLIAYSLGNFCTPFGVSIVGVSGYAPLLEVKTDGAGRLTEARIHSFIQKKGCGPVYDPEQHALKEIKGLTQQDFPKSGLRFYDDGRVLPAHCP